MQFFKIINNTSCHFIGIIIIAFIQLVMLLSRKKIKIICIENCDIFRDLHNLNISKYCKIEKINCILKRAEKYLLTEKCFYQIR